MIWNIALEENEKKALKYVVGEPEGAYEIEITSGSANDVRAAWQGYAGLTGIVSTV